jgi:hypothetical protein
VAHRVVAVDVVAVDGYGRHRDGRFMIPQIHDFGDS